MMLIQNNKIMCNPVGGIMVSVLASSAVDGGFEPRSGQTKDYKIDICNRFKSKSVIQYCMSVKFFFLLHYFSI
jgi:hypothetical protein